MDQKKNLDKIEISIEENQNLKEKSFFKENIYKIKIQPESERINANPKDYKLEENLNSSLPESNIKKLILEDDNILIPKKIELMDESFDPLSLTKHFDIAINKNSSVTDIGLFIINNKTTSNKMIYKILHRRIESQQNNIIDNFFFQDVTEHIDYKKTEIYESKKSKKFSPKFLTNLKRL